MRIRLVLIALLLSSFIPVAHAQDTAYLEDDEGDAMAYVAGEPVSPPGGAEALDLTAIYFSELPEGFETTFEVAALSSDGTPLDRADYRFYLQYGNLTYAIVVERDFGPLGEGPYYWGAVAEVVHEGTYEYLSYRDGMEVEVTDTTMTVIAPRDALTDELGAPAGAGAVFTDTYAEARGVQMSFVATPVSQEPTYQVRDRMPDEGLGDPIEVVMGVVQEGDAMLYSEAPFRLSNGGATSMVYDVQAVNAGPRQTFALSVDDLPDEWDVQLPFDRFALDEEEFRTFPILVTTPAKHVHGGSDSFILTMTGQQDNGDIGRLEIGVKYPDVPQPAGHHPRLWLHSHSPWPSDPVSDLLGFNSIQGYMNALEEDPGDLGEPIPAWGNVVPGVEGDFQWYIPLIPRLGMGLDFDVDEDATLEIPINYEYVAQDAVLSGTMSLWSDAFEDRVTVGTLQPTSPASWGPGTHTFEAVMDIHDEADFIPYAPDAYLYLELRLEGTFVGVGPFGPDARATISPGAQMMLPLNEYRDEVTGFYEAVEALRFDAEYLERYVNPGKTLVFETHLRNVGKDTETVDLNLTGVNADWARVLGDQSFELDAGQERSVAVAVTIPDDATDGGIVDLVLKAASVDDPFKQTIVSLAAIIDTEAEHADESGKVEDLDKSLSDDKKSPGFEIAAILLGLLALALIRRR